jgi:8-oxo-dGTP diphosphatase
MIHVAAAVVWNEGRVLMTQRPPGGAHPLLWEFPGGKIESGETAERALVREIQEELGVEATTFERMAVCRHEYAGGPSVEIVFVRCTLHSHAFQRSAAVHALRWSHPDQIDLAGVLAGDHEFLKLLRSRPAVARAPGDQDRPIAPAPRESRD